MDVQDIEKLMVAMTTHHIHKVHVKRGEHEIILEKAGFCPAPMIEMVPAAKAAVSNHVPKEAPAAAAGQFVTSPIVGTFYTSSSPEAPAFIKVGDKVSEETIICIVEAMKVMNEVKAGLCGTVVEVLLKNGDPVEFGTKIVKIA
jgi:acetyl-CoA carboxylase biotin carboxyl carrier protein